MNANRIAGAMLGLALAWALAGCGETMLLIPDPAARYVAFGDSSSSGRAGRRYPEILADLLAVPPEAMANQGRDGETTGAGLERLRQLLALRIYPNATTLLYWQGAADIIDVMAEVDGLLLLAPESPGYPYAARLTEKLDRVQANIEAAVGAAQAAGLTVYVATYFSLREVAAPCDPLPLEIVLPYQARNANGYVSLLNARIRQAAASTGAVLVDVAAADDLLHADAANFLNCNHLSEQGNAIVARLFAEALAP